MDMKNIEFNNDLFAATTYGVSSAKPKVAQLADPFLVLAGQGATIGVETCDEIPLFFACDGVLGAAKIRLEDAVDESFRDRFHAAKTQYNLNPENIVVYMGPCLTFSHTHVERSLMDQLMDRGYRAACKRTDGVDFLDVPVMVLQQLRELGVKMENIHISDYDTYENPTLLHSHLRGDTECNVTIASLK